LKSPEGWDDDIFDGQSGFNALPGGQIFNGVSYGLNSVAHFWTSPVFNDNKAGARLVYYKSGIYRYTDAGNGSGKSICLSKRLMNFNSSNSPIFFCFTYPEPVLSGRASAEPTLDLKHLPAKRAGVLPFGLEN